MFPALFMLFILVFNGFTINLLWCFIQHKIFFNQGLNIFIMLNEQNEYVLI